MTALQLGSLIHHGHIAAAFSELYQQVLTDVGMGHFASTESNGDFAPVALGQELLRVAHFYIEVIHVDTGRHTDLFDLHHALVLTGFLLSLGLLEPELAVIHQFTHRGHGVRGNLDQIQTLLLGHAKSFLSRHDAQLFAGVGDQSNLFVANFFIGLMSCVSDGKHLQTKNNAVSTNSYRIATKTTPKLPVE